MLHWLHNPREGDCLMEMKQNGLMLAEHCLSIPLKLKWQDDPSFITLK